MIISTESSMPHQATASFPRRLAHAQQKIARYASGRCWRMPVRAKVEQCSYRRARGESTNAAIERASLLDELFAIAPIRAEAREAASP